MNGSAIYPEVRTNPNGKAHAWKSTPLNSSYDIDILGDDHLMTGSETPLRSDAFLLTEDEKIRIIEGHFREIMHTLGLDLTDDSLMGTPRRVAKMYVKEIFKGLNPENKPGISVFENAYGYNRMLVEKNIKVKSTCEHHFLPILGKAHLAYYSSGKVIGLSKLNRIVDYFARRPQVQERMTMQIAEELKKALKTEDVAVLIEASHHCVICRGIEDEGSTTVTSAYGGKFNEAGIREEFLRYVQLDMS
ncbi:MAG TPA: GTP cyclohydrolase I FolE [Bacteroidales bacterium]|nr:GTP cyclohydrolase I FolE [Bacteroidales bacterium]HRZ75807.1 GTP cyclohydrolase I FolE [Bacteroidales bacterium]